MKNNIAEMLLSHYEEFLGNYSSGKLYKFKEGASIQVLEYEKVFEGCKTYVSFGVSNFSGHIHNKCEIVLNVDNDFDRASCIFANVLMYLIENKVHFYKGSYIGGIAAFNEDFCAEHKKAGIYITEAYPFPKEFLLCDDIKIYMCFFISNEELEYLKKYGSDRFEDYLEEKEIDVMELNRAAFINIDPLKLSTKQTEERLC